MGDIMHKRRLLKHSDYQNPFGTSNGGNPIPIPWCWHLIWMFGTRENLALQKSTRFGCCEINSGMSHVGTWMRQEDLWKFHKDFANFLKGLLCFLKKLLWEYGQYSEICTIWLNVTDSHDGTCIGWLNWLVSICTLTLSKVCALSSVAGFKSSDPYCQFCFSFLPPWACVGLECAVCRT